jgi:L-alanine-DL-glutamate epimerase-like enolase superfamily enzyme
MRVTQVETICLTGLFPQFVFVQVHTDAGLVGLGQTADFRTVGVIHDLAERFVLGRDPTHVEALWAEQFRFAGLHGYAGAELRAISAFDIALWDLLGQQTGLPVYALLGGPCRERLRIYNTCSAYGSRSDRELAQHDPARLVAELLAAGITCVKVAVYDEFAHESHGQAITPAQLRQGASVLERLLRAGEGQMEVMVELHGAWSLTGAVEIAASLRDLPVHWLEDPIWQDNAEAWASLRQRSPIRIAGSERLYTRHQVRRLLELQGTDVLIADVTWTGGISELKKMAAMAEAYGVPIAAHDHSGPVNLWASAHVLLNAPNAYMMETTRVFYEEYYDALVVGDPILRAGFIHLPSGPGLGISLRPEVRERLDAVVQRSSA